MKGKRKRELRKKVMESDRKINKRNKNLMIDKILSYNPILLEGIEVYKDANRNFTLLIVIGALLIDFPLISVPCCILSMFFIIKMLQFIKYKSINNIVKELAKDLSFKGIYDKEKVARKTLNTQLKSAKLEGIEEGKLEGKKEGKIEIAKLLIEKNNMTLEEISEITGLTKEEIENLK